MALNVDVLELPLRPREEADPILVVGSISLDTIETPFGREEETLGGSAYYFATGASLFAPVRLVGVVGEDFPEEAIEFLRARGVDDAGLQRMPGRTFRWHGRYEYDLNVAHTLDTQLNVFADFRPVLPETYRHTPLVFLANIAPQLQMEVLEQVHAPRLAVLDTMNFWIEGAREELEAAVRQVDVVLMNEGELRQFTGTHNLLAGARKILAMGPRAVAVKRGEYGAALFQDDQIFVVPAYPLEEVQDPTGAGDTFAAGFLGYLARAGRVDDLSLRRAVVFGSVVASFTVQDFSVRRLQTLTWDEIADRYRDFVRFTHFAGSAVTEGE